MPAPATSRRRLRRPLLPRALAWLIIGLGVMHVTVSTCFLIHGLGGSSGEVWAMAAPLAPILADIEPAGLRWLLASGLAQAVAMLLVPFLLRTGPGLAWDALDWPAGAALDATVWTGPALTERSGVIAVRISNLESIVNLHGRAAAQRTLTATARALRENARRSDIVTRTGSDRFAVVLTDTDPAAIATTAARLRQAIKAVTVHDAANNAVAIEARLGWSAGEAQGLGTLLDLANAALHDARRETAVRVPG